jgi:type III secretion protein V
MSREIVFLASPGTASPIETGMPADRDPVVDLIECVRVSLRRYISHKYTRGAATLVVHLVDPDLEQRLGDPAPLTADERARLLAAVAAEMPETLIAPLPVILTTASLRARLRREIHREFPRLAVLSYQELSPDMNIQPLSRITWS